MSTPSLANYVSGFQQVTSDNLNTFFQTCTNMAQLRAFAGNNPAITVYVRGTTSVNDGGQGTFYWNAGVTGTDDNGVTTVVPNGVTIGCWTRQNVGTTLLGTSSTSNTIGTGLKTFNVSQSGAALTAGGFVVIVSRANIANYMHGQINSYSGSTLIVNVTDTGGSGTFADWNIILSGTQGSAGSSPAFNTITNGTNTTAAMLVGTGGSLSPTGTGTITATGLASATTVVSVSGATAPTGGQVLVAINSTSASWQSSATGALVLLNTQLATSSPNINFGSAFITATYTKYRIELIDVIPSANAHLSLRVSEDNGSTIKSGSTDYSYTGTRTTAAAAATSSFGSVGASSADSTNGDTATGAGFAINASIDIFDPTNATTFKYMRLAMNHMDSSDSNSLCKVDTTWLYKSTTNAVNYIRLFLSGSATFVSGTFKLYGIV